MENTKQFKVDQYYKYDEIKSLLINWQKEFPDVFSYEVIGQSHEKRDLWAVTLTAKTEQKPCEKPAYYIDANHHAGEVTGSSVALYTIDFLLRNFRAKDKRVLRLLKDYTFYIIPRIAVDGSEKYLTTPFMLRSSVREYSPNIETGTIMKDIDGDGQILQMRVKSQTGRFKKSQIDPRLMIRRQPDDIEGDFYDVLIEGEIEDFDGVEIKPYRAKWGLDFNRNYPMNWQPELKQKGAGPYPLSELETRSVAEFVLNHKNIAGIMSYHTTGGIILRPYCTNADKKMPEKDLKAFKLLGEIGENQTGYPCWSIYEKFTVDKDNPSVGSFMDFIYDYLGIMSFATELWDLRGRAGLAKLDLQKRIDQTIKEEEQDGLALLKYSDEKFAGELFIDWYNFEHPQLGQVELGGWQTKIGRQNPPLSLLEEECRKNMLFTLSHAESMPKLKWLSAEIKSLGENKYKIRVEYVNSGYLTSSGSEMAEMNKIANDIKVGIDKGVELLNGRHEVVHSPLAGYQKNYAEWVISAKTGDKIGVYVKTQRAGNLRKELII